MSSNCGTQGNLRVLVCPFLNIKIGFPFFPTEDQLLGLLAFFTVEPKRIELPHLPSYIISPSYGNKG